MTDLTSPSAYEFASLARSLIEAQGFAPTLRQIVDSAVDLVPCQWAAVAVSPHLGNHPARHSTSSDEDLGAIVARIAGQAGDSPGISAFSSGGTVHCPDLALEEQYAAYRDGMLSETPVRSVLSIAIRVHDTTVGVLTMYAAQPGAFDGAALERAHLLTEHAALAIATEISGDRADNLEVALRNSRTIGAAIGILTERLRIPPGQALERLRAASQQGNRKISDLATELVETGTLAGPLADLLAGPAGP
ncbi:GAF and ANTAR domain-containing protein [Terrabacter terrigena]|uniref:GAF and ANTAR domain-containing protein n=1 Tax=Terrabacter terrigena TaxID=574718 RepID=A0ABW3MTU6_9MICO